MKIRSKKTLYYLFYLAGIIFFIPTTLVFSEDHTMLAFTEKQFPLKLNNKIFIENLNVETVDQNPSANSQIVEHSFEHKRNNNSPIRVFQIPLDNRSGIEKRKTLYIGLSLPIGYLDKMVQANESIFSGLEISNDLLHKKYLNTIDKEDYITLSINFEINF